MRSDLLNRIHSLSLENDQRRQVMELFGCFCLATVALRMRKMTSEDRTRIEQQIERILECAAPFERSSASRREDPTLPVGLRRWLWKGDPDGRSMTFSGAQSPSSGRPLL